MRISLTILVAVVFSTASACSDDEASTTAIDASVVIDATTFDASPADAAVADAVPPDAVPPDADPHIIVTIPASKDATICSDGGDGNSIGDGLLFVGHTDEPTVRRAFVEFDLSTIPADATNLDAQLDLQVTQVQGTVSVAAHRVTTDWNEGATVGAGSGGGKCGTSQADDASWVATGLGGDWTAEGGDFEATATGTAAALSGFSIDGLGADVTAWKSVASPNHGWILKAVDESVRKNIVRLASPPNLVVRYLPAP